MTAHEIERSVGSVLKDYGLRLTLHAVEPLTDVWNVVFAPRQSVCVRVAMASNSQHHVRRAVMAALKIDE